MMEKDKNRMPVLFIGHGSPMNAIEENEFTKDWREIRSLLPKPKAILSISAHWFTPGTRINDSEHPKPVYDMYGFPKELYEIVYDAPGSPELANRVKALLSDFPVKVDNSWGTDHGTWSVLHILYPEKEISVIQLSIDRNAPPEVHFHIGELLRPLREEGVLIFGSGNVVHHLGLLDFSMDGGYPWAEEFDHYISERILSKDYKDVVDYKKAGEAALRAFPTPDHFYPLLYVLGASTDSDVFSVRNQVCMAGSLSMTCYIGSPADHD